MSFASVTGANDMLTLEELIELRTALAAESKLLIDTAEKDNDGKGRDLTDEEPKRSEEI